ncbi:hypothetical protein M422DRAFT_81380, partial [Sphaerobolus stellatus SS14]
SLAHLAKGGTSLSVFNALKHTLTPVQEGLLLDYMLESADQGFPLAHQNIEQFPNAILKASPSSRRRIGQNWVDWPVERHHDQLQLHWNKPLDTAHAHPLNLTAVYHWFN